MRPENCEAAAVHRKRSLRHANFSERNTVYRMVNWAPVVIRGVQQIAGMRPRVRPEAEADRAAH